MEGSKLLERLTLICSIGAHGFLIVLVLSGKEVADDSLFLSGTLFSAIAIAFHLLLRYRRSTRPFAQVATANHKSVPEDELQQAVQSVKKFVHDMDSRLETLAYNNMTKGERSDSDLFLLPKSLKWPFHLL